MVVILNNFLRYAILTSDMRVLVFTCVLVSTEETRQASHQVSIVDNAEVMFHFTVQFAAEHTIANPGRSESDPLPRNTQI